jgi:ABC-type oligopeptide transport system ATPase subunit
VSFDLRRGKTLGLVGESGSGKTTVGMTLMRLHEATSGQALFEGKDILAMTPREFDCALAGRMGGRAAVAAGCPPDKRALADLMRRFPD